MLRDIERMDEEDGMESNGSPSQPQEAAKGEFQRLEGYNLWMAGLVTVHFLYCMERSFRLFSLPVDKHDSSLFYHEYLIIKVLKLDIKIVVTHFICLWLKCDMYDCCIGKEIVCRSTGMWRWMVLGMFG